MKYLESDEKWLPTCQTDLGVLEVKTRLWRILLVCLIFCSVVFNWFYIF